MQNTTVPFSSIIVPERLRKDYGDIDTLADSIAQNELICPLTVEDCGDGTYMLIAGGRRYCAIEVLRKVNAENGNDIFHNVPVYIKYNASTQQKRIWELEENIRRKAMTWQEECVGIAQVHVDKDRDAVLDASAPDWTQQMTGDLFGVSNTKVNFALQLADALEQGDGEITTAENANVALQIIAKRRIRALEKRAAELKDAELALRQARAKVVEDTPSELGIDIPDLGNLTLKSAAIDTYARAKTIIWHADSHDEMCKMHGVYDGIITDIPYGIDSDNLNLKHIDETKAEHDRDENIALFDMFLRLAFQCTKSTAFCVFWYDVEHTTTLMQLASSHGWRPQRWPLHAKKAIAKNEAAGYNTTKDYESVMVLAKPNTTLVTRRSTSFIPWEWAPGEREKYAHPFCKPYSANHYLLHTFFTPGAKLLDPYCGEGSGVLAGLRDGYDITGIDKMEHHVIRAREHAENELK